MEYLSVQEIQEALLMMMQKYHDFCEKNELEYYMIGGTMLGAFRHHGFIPWDDDMDVGMTRAQYKRFLELVDEQKPDFEVHNFTNTNPVDYGLTRIYIEHYYEDNEYDEKLDKHLYFDIFPLDAVPVDEKKQKQQSKYIKKWKNVLYLKASAKYCEGSVFKKIFKRMYVKLLEVFPYNYLVKRVSNVMEKYSNEKSGYICSMYSQYPYEKQKMAESVFGNPTPYEFEGKWFYGVECPEIYLSQLYGSDYMDLPPVEKRKGTAKVYYSNNK